MKKDGTPGTLKVLRLSTREIAELTSEEDRTLIGLLVGNERDLGYGSAYAEANGYFKVSEFAISPAMFDIVLPQLCGSGRFGWLQDDSHERDNPIRLLAWDDGPAWKLVLEVTKSADRKCWQLGGKLARGIEVEELSGPLAVLSVGLAIFPGRIARFDPCGSFSWGAMLREIGPLQVPVKEEQEFVQAVAELPSPLLIEWPSELRWEEQCPVPSPALKITKSRRTWNNDLECLLTFRYGDRSASFGSGPPAWYERGTRSAIRRNLAAEQSAFDQLLAAGAHRGRYYDSAEQGPAFVAPNKMIPLVLRLISLGWSVEAEGRPIRSAGKVSLSVTSGIDWFDLEGACDFGGISAPLPTLLAALRKGERFVALGDGSQGMLPDEWLARFGGLVELGETKGDRLQFSPAQAGLLDALLAAQETDHVAVDKAFARLRDKLQAFDGIRPHKEPKSFIGTLRPYQRNGLGWLHFLDEIGVGGCLADDMGLGKTVQVLALLDERRTKAGGPRRTPQTAREPSLVVVPRSLVFNWMDEASRFTPKLRVLNYTGLDRAAGLSRLDEYDLVVTTYGTLRRDAAKLVERQFDVVILDEAQAIKNASSQAAKACRLLKARRRLAMTGTPVENHLGELWSLFEFLNPGMLGRSKKGAQLFNGRRDRVIQHNGVAELPEEVAGEPAEDIRLLARSLRPFMLRRTKKQVLAELPEKTEQTLFCELGDSERRLYNELREHYRESLLARVNKVGVKKSKIHVLEALLRLRQAACHPGLLDKKALDAGSAKLDALLEQLQEVIDEGHKALVFSQFTSLLAIVRRRLDHRPISYEYLDGKTRKRQAAVERFQTDAACRLFLISLKAGGQGLNLTAADYVFILDPWWNPAVEAQAVDRAHRLGQDRHVFAYRLIARQTVEEKILQLQNHKRDLAEAIVSADNSLLQSLTLEDLQLLLS
ncbi:MAG TPA: DEAD/DEAH box helicase [Pirellulales bacterium]|nr:DEAD/DEAH box helicase [Pirellulales bacterium]